jgi:hypothetical protein
MAIVDQKKKVLSQVAALKTLNEGFPTFKLTNSLSSINNKQDSLDFLVDLLKTLIGYEKLRDSLVDLLSTELDNIELTVKKSIKKDLKSFINCSSDPSIPDFIKHQSVLAGQPGVDLELNKIDFTELMFIDPTSQVGHMFYDDQTAGLNSTDFNTFLFSTIQDGNQQDWSDGTNDILSLDFNASGTINNVINVRASAFYSTPANGKTLTDLNNDYIDSVKLFPSDKVMTNIIDSLFGTVSSKTDKTATSLLSEEQVNTIINNFINADDDETIDDSFFQFTNEEVRTQRETANNRQNGIRKLETCENVESKISLSSLSTITSSVSASTTTSQKKEVVSSGLNTMADELSSNVSGADKNNAKLNFIDLLIRKIILAIVNIIISPKLIMLFAINNKIVNGASATFDGPLDFIRQNKTLFKAIVNSVRNAIVSFLLRIVLKEVSRLIAEQAIGNLTEKTNAATSQLLSLVGVPQSVLRIISNLG